MISNNHNKTLKSRVLFTEVHKTYPGDCLEGAHPPPLAPGLEQLQVRCDAVLHHLG